MNKQTLKKLEKLKQKISTIANELSIPDETDKEFESRIRELGLLVYIEKELNNIINDEKRSFVEFRNDSHSDLIARIVNVESTGNTFIYIEDLPSNISLEKAKELHELGYEHIKSGWYSHVEKVVESKF